MNCCSEVIKYKRFLVSCFPRFLTWFVPTSLKLPGRGSSPEPRGGSGTSDGLLSWYEEEDDDDGQDVMETISVSICVLEGGMTL